MAACLSAAGRTSKLNIIPLSWCSAMWQCAIHRPGLVTSSRMSTISPVRTSTVSFQTRFGSTSPSRARTRNRPAPWTWNGWCIGWSESISLTSRIFTRSPTRNCQSIAWFSAPVARSTSFQRMFAGVVIWLTSTMSSSHSIPPPRRAHARGRARAVRRGSWPSSCAVARACSARRARLRLATSVAGSSFMPHYGQRPGSSLVTSGCIGHA